MRPSELVIRTFVLVLSSAVKRPLRTSQTRFECLTLKMKVADVDDLVDVRTRAKIGASTSSRLFQVECRVVRACKRSD